MLYLALLAIDDTFKFEVKNGVVWLDDRKQPTQEEINKKIKELEAEYKATQYQRDRAVEYSKLNQDELRFDDLENGTTTWQDSINAIKQQFPKS